LNFYDSAEIIPSQNELLDFLNWFDVMVSASPIFRIPRPLAAPNFLPSGLYVGCVSRGRGFHGF
jgi:hypothetical protein